ncbi:PREDICTED: transient receptor potential protein-like [Trachymyrmex cornetzi]|uniref:transient receptor potential protein-like n=1 Tax=Trachymyrmex cornetzi TaxID=471704 RepID=UPI00084F3D82|nr:PREDICTED: transient receptor potential protein-like [Trachymyrmex cornetzi]
MNPSESQQDLLSNEMRPPSMQSLQTPNVDYILGPVEKHFLLSAERGDCATVKRLIEENQDHPEILNINCVDPLNRSALIAAIENENVELIKLLLELGIDVKDALLHAIKEEYVEAVEILLEWEEKIHKPGHPYSWEAADSSSNFTSDITPLILAAHKNNYEILKLLLDRGATLPTPHDARCGCDECVMSSEQDSLRHSQSRINAYRALTSSSLIALSSKDPLLTAFELSWELRRLSRMEQEFRAQYNEMREQTQQFATSLLDHARTSYELEVMLNYNPTGENWDPGERQTLDRLKLAIKYKQKQFVSHPNVQQLLAAIWYDGLPGFRRKNMIAQLMEVAKLGAMFPVYSIIYMIAPSSQMGSFMKKPFVKFICHSASYAFFLMLLGMASQRIEYLLIELFGNEWMREILANWKKRERGCIPGFVETGVVIYVISLIIGEIKALWADGLIEYMSDLWNIVDFIQNTFYVIWISMRITAWWIVQREYWDGLDPWYPRDKWHAFDPMLLSEGAFAAGMIFSFLKLVHIFSVNPHLGPLQISLGRMIIDIIKFFFIYTLVLFAFGCGMNQLMWYYADLEKRKCYHVSDEPDFDNQEKACSIWRRFANLFETSQSLFWASFGMVDLMSFDLTGIKSFTRFWALLMFGSYSVINIIVLLNMLIAMMSNSYQIISERSDTEWKFARSNLWMSYFEDGDTVPPPFNMIPTNKTLRKLFKCGSSNHSTRSFIKKSREQAMMRHDTVVRLLIRRYVTSEQRKRDEFGITEDDVREIRQDISSFRYDLINILRKNGMCTPMLDKEETNIPGKKGKVMERRLQKDFQIGIVEGIVQAVIQSEKEPKDVFSQIAKAIGRKGSGVGKKDWNAVVRQSTIAMDPIGSTNEAMQRQTRRSLRRQLRHQPDSDLASMDPKRLLDYNPNLSDFTPITRIAYAKFMLSKNKPDEQLDDTNDNETEEAPRRSSKVMITEPSTNVIPRPATETFKKSLLESTNSVNKQAGLIAKAEGKSPSPIPEDSTGEEISKQSISSATFNQENILEDSVGQEISKQSISSATFNQEKKVEETENVQEQQREENEVTSGRETLDEQKEKETENYKYQQSKNTEGNNSDNTGQKTSEVDKEIDTEKCVESDITRKKLEVPVQTTKLQGKSKATGRVIGGWI